MIQLFQGDSFELIKGIESNSINLVQTDVPYPDMEIHDRPKHIIYSDQWIEWFDPLAKEIQRVLTPDGSFVTTINSKIDRTFYFKWVLHMTEVLGFNYVMTYYWVKKNIIPGKMKIPRDGVDFIAHFTKTADFKINLKAVKNHKIYNQQTKCPTNLIHASNRDDKSYYQACKELGVQHPGKYPSLIPDFFIRILTDEGDSILEPFNGTGTTTLKAEQLNRKSIGFELNPINVKISKKIYEIEKVPCQITL